MLIGGFLLYEKYSRKDVFRILNWEQNPVAQNVGGYMPSKDKVDCAIFVNYDKSDHSLSTKYVDAFLDHQVGTSVERAYRRGDLLEKRRSLMQFYGDYACSQLKQI